MGNKVALCSSSCSSGSKSSKYTDSYQSTASSASLKKSFANGEIGKDNFKILKVIGRGSFGKVFLVEKRGSHEILAMKVLKKSNILERN